MNALIVFTNQKPKANSHFVTFDWGYYIPQYLLFVVKEGSKFRLWVKSTCGSTQKQMKYTPTGRKQTIFNSYCPHYKNVGARVKFEYRPAGVQVSTYDEKELEYVDAKSVDAKIADRVESAETIQENHKLVKYTCE